jgi:hypothetical protein
MNRSAIPPGSRASVEASTPGAGNASEVLAEHPSIPFWTIPLGLLVIALAVKVALITVPPNVQPYGAWVALLAYFSRLGVIKAEASRHLDEGLEQRSLAGKPLSS